MTLLDNAVGASMRTGSALPQSPSPNLSPNDQVSPQLPSPNVWTKPAEGFAKLSFCFVGQWDCGFSSVTARDNNDALLAIWCQKILQHDP
ncbi:hypothetical protein TorRG33x02_276860 [Trema orientale]|uniref:Uncharacterized protein n=1 Tax=Trema orientale TaxID=63057 RepID=A0A2P5CQ57_TREOI|nr:hypothetical protein TorRG33x02_276860 [Trema orientale]